MWPGEHFTSNEGLTDNHQLDEMNWAMTLPYCLGVLLPIIQQLESCMSSLKTLFSVVWHNRLKTAARMSFSEGKNDSEEPLIHHGPTYNNESWTTVTSDGELFKHLLALYFCWEYLIFVSLSKEDFIQDFRRGTPKILLTLTRQCASCNCF
jgi:hypothetical protein